MQLHFGCEYLYQSAQSQSCILSYARIQVHSILSYARIQVHSVHGICTLHPDFICTYVSSGKNNCLFGSNAIGRARVFRRKRVRVV